ncbi:DNA/RNA nuclease SfsA [Marinobacteraceae bacterium S3BR75-40.1]
MQFDPPLLRGTLVQRYKRFLADIDLADGQRITAHCPNTGSMLNCKAPGSTVWVTHNPDPKRKLAYTWELVETAPGVVACINTARPNRLVEEALTAQRIPQLGGYPTLRREVKYGQEKSRIDLLLQGHPEQPDAWIEVKNVTLGEDEQGYFPDAVTTRGQKHLRELATLAGEGQRAVLMFCVCHSGVTSVRPADHIDPEYGRLLREAMAAGVEVLAWQAEMSAEGMELVRALPVTCG